MKPLPTIAVLSVLALFVHAEIQWEKKELEFHPGASDTQVEASFRFTNSGSTTVTIREVVASCDCTAAALDKKTYQPGESGQITATFKFGERTGRQEKTLKVTVEGEKEPTILSLVTHIPESVKITPSFVSWQVGDALEPKTIDITASPGTTMRITKVTSSIPTMVSRIETVQEGSKYRLVLTPADTSAPAAAILYIDSTLPGDVHRSLTAYAHVKRTRTP